MTSRFERRKRELHKQVDVMRRQFLQAKGLPFGNLLDTRVVGRLAEEERPNSYDRIYSTVVTLWAFLMQVLDADHSCRKAVARVQAWRASKNLDPCSPRTGAYCRARQRLPLALLRRLLWWVAQKLQSETPEKWLWKGRNVKIMDGSTVTMPDTSENQKEYPQQRAQKKGLGFPIARFVAVFSLATGAALDVAIGKMRGGKSEKGLLQEIWANVFQPGDLALGDRHFVGYCDVALALRRGVDVVLRQHQARSSDFRRGKRLGKDDHLVILPKPRQRPPGFPKELFLNLPSTLTLREVRFQIKQKGFRVREIILISSLLDPTEVTREELAQLFRLRWDAELDLRSIKDVMQMDVLRCKTPEMVRKEIYAHLIAYNLIRGIIAQAAARDDVHPREISFKGALQTLDSFLPLLWTASRTHHQFLKDRILCSISCHPVRNRPDRYEPRAVKRRPKPYPLLMSPRPQARRKIERKRA